MMRPKENPVRSKLYRRIVAAMPCIFCGLHGHSQAAHPPPSGKGIKEDDRLCFPLCSVRPGIAGCHQDFDQYRIYPHDKAHEAADLWAKQTQTKIKANGDWREEWD